MVAAKQHDYDVAIVGGGLVGSTLALALEKATRFKVLVVEAIPMPAQTSYEKPVYRASYDARGSAISRGTAKIFHQLGIWEELKQHASSVQRVHVSDKGHFGSTLIEAQKENVPALGYVIENHWIGNVLLGAVSRCQRVDWVAPARVSDVKPMKDGVRFRIQQQNDVQEKTCRLLVVADGAGSETCRQLGVAFEEVDYQQTALVTNVTPAKPHDFTAYERFTETGPLAVLPLVQNRYAVVWCHPSGQEELHLNGSDETFLADLQETFGNRVGRFEKVGKRFAYPLKKIIAMEQVRPNVVIMGNAAHSLHPVAGQGFNLSVRDIAFLVQLLAKANPQHIGDLSLLQEYEAFRLQDQFKVTQFSGSLVKLFSNRNPILSVLRNIGLMGFELWPQGKETLATHAMGANQHYDIQTLDIDSLEIVS